MPQNSTLQTIQQCTGHRSLKALRTYERTTEEQELAVSKILTSNKKIDYTLSLPSEQSKVGASATQVPNQQSPVLPAEQPCNLAPNHMLKQLCQVSQSQSFAPNLLAVLPIVLSMSILENLLLLSNFMARKILTISFQRKWIYIYKALSSIDFNF